MIGKRLFQLSALCADTFVQMKLTTSRCSRRTHSGLFVVLFVAGCALPDYHQPRGFSSTYYRQLQQAQQFTPLAPVPGAEPTPTPTPTPKTSWPWMSDPKTSL